MTGPDLSIVMVTYNGRDQVLATLRSARESARGVAVEWLVVDNGSLDGTPAAIEDAFRDIRVIRGPNVGFAAGNNTALPLATGRHVLLLNPDIEIVEGKLGELVAIMDARPEIGAASVIQRGQDGTIQRTIRHFPSPLRALGEALLVNRLTSSSIVGEEARDVTTYVQEQPADWLVGAFLIARREAIEEIGLLDERFFLYSEEADWCYRFGRAGWEVRHLPAMAVVHHTPGYEMRPELTAQLSLSKLLFAKKHFSRPRQGAFRAAVLLRHLIRLLASTVAAPFAPTMRARAAAELYVLRVLLGKSEAPFTAR